MKINNQRLMKILRQQRIAKDIPYKIPQWVQYVQSEVIDLRCLGN